MRRVNRTKPWNGDHRIFCISMQRSGTTSVGDFFNHFGYSVARWNDSSIYNWSKLWYDGNFEEIFASRPFYSSQVFEDDPWWMPEFYKFLYHRFPNAKFILLTRNSDAWFRSMMSHSLGRTIGNTKIHCKVYRREKEFWFNVSNNSNFNPSETEVDNLLSIRDYGQYYKAIYETRNQDIIEFFKRKNPNRLFYGSLEDLSIWNKLGAFFGIDVPKNFQMHSNKS